MRIPALSLAASPQPSTTARLPSWRGELSGGVAGAVASLALALSVGLLAYAPLGPAHAYLGVMAGLASAIYGQLIAGALGGSTHPGSTPRASVSLVLGGVVAGLVADPALAPISASAVERVVALAGATVVIAGALQLLFGLLGLGTLARYVPYPFIAGFMAGAAALILLSQLTPVTGVTGSELLHDPGAAWQSLHTGTLLVALATIWTMWRGPRHWPRVPAALLGLLAGTVAYYALQAVAPALPLGTVIGAMRADFPLPTAIVPLFDIPADVLRRHAADVLAGAVVIAVIGSLDTLFAAVAVDHASDGRHDARRELVAHGLANMASGVCGGVPVVLSPARAIASWNAGGRTRWSAVIAALLLATVAGTLMPMIAWLPIPVIGGVMIMLGVGLIDAWTRGLVARLHAARMRPDATLLWSVVTVAVVALSAIFAGFMAAVAVGILFSGLLFIVGMNRSLVRSIVDGTVRPSRRIWGGADGLRVQKARARIRIVELQGALFFGSAERLAGQVEPLVGHADAVVLDFRRVTAIDATGALLVERLARRLARRRTHLLLANVSETTRHGASFLAHGAFRDPESRAWFPDADQAIEWAENQSFEATGRTFDHDVPLAGFALLDGMDREEIDYIAGRLERREVPSGTVLFREHDPGDRLCMIAQGAVEISIAAGAHRVRIVTMAAGSFFGEAALLDGRPRSASAEAVEDTVVWELTRTVLDTISRDRPVLAMRIMTNLARQLSIRMRETNEILRQLENTPG